MLMGLKEDMRKLNEGDTVADLMIESMSNAGIRDRFLDDPNTDLMGAEDDPEIADLIGSLPGFDKNEESLIQDEIKTLSEGLVETVLEGESAEDLRGKISSKKGEVESLKAEIAAATKNGDSSVVESKKEELKNAEAALRDFVARSKV